MHKIVWDYLGAYANLGRRQLSDPGYNTHMLNMGVLYLNPVRQSSTVEQTSAIEKTR